MSFKRKMKTASHTKPPRGPNGGNASLEVGGVFARTHAAVPTHESFDLLKAFHFSIKHLIPDNIQLFGENCFALHSIAYDKLPGYFLLFNIREINKDNSKWYSWDEVEMWAEEIGVPTVPVLFKGTVSSEEKLKELIKSFMIEPSVYGPEREGIVARIAKDFYDSEFSSSVMKCVRKNHVDKNSDHWKNKKIIRNKLAI